MTTGEKQKDVEKFYGLMEKLRKNIGYHYLSDCDGKMGWPDQGVYFFFDCNQKRENSTALRVVRVGTHAVSKGSQSTLWERLRQHRGSAEGLSGNHRGSVFRKLVGNSFIKDPQYSNCSSWNKKSISETDRKKELILEEKVSEYINKRPFLWIKVEGEANNENKRAFIEKKSIALLSKYLETPETSTDWQGKYCEKKEVELSQLWNSKHVKDSYEPNDKNHPEYGNFLELLDERIAETERLKLDREQKECPSLTP